MDEAAIRRALTPNCSRDKWGKQGSGQCSPRRDKDEEGGRLAHQLASLIESIEGIKPPVGVLDITLYRDDLTALGPAPIVHRTEVDFNITGKIIVLVDDVIFTGEDGPGCIGRFNGYSVGPNVFS